MFAQFFSEAAGIGSTLLVRTTEGRRSPIVSQQSKSFEPERILVCASGKVAAVPEVEPTPEAFLEVGEDALLHRHRKTDGAQLLASQDRRACGIGRAATR